MNRARRHSPRSFELGRNARQRLVGAAYQGRLLQGIAASAALYWGKNGPAVANCASLPSNLFRAIQGRTLMLPLRAFIALVVTWCLLAVAAIVAASIQRFEDLYMYVVGAAVFVGLIIVAAIAMAP